MSSFRWKRKFDNATDEYFNSHLPLKSTTSRVIYLVLQFINLIYDETELLDFTALALPAVKNLSATYGVYCERKQHYIETFLSIRAPSQQVMENCLAKKTAYLGPDFHGQMVQRRSACSQAPEPARCRKHSGKTSTVSFRSRELAPMTRS